MAISALAAAGLGAVAGGGLGFLTGQKGERKEFGQLNPVQESLFRELGPFASQVLNRGAEGLRFGGQLSEPISQEELDFIAQGGAANKNRINALSGLVSGAFDPATFNKQFSEEVAQPAFRDFEQFQRPLIDEGFDRFAHSGVPRARGEALSRLSGQLSTEKFAARLAAKERIQRGKLGAAGLLTDATESATRLAGVPRGIKQAGLDREYLDFIQSNEQFGQYLNFFLGFLGLSTVTEREDTRGASALAGAIGGGGLGAQLSSADSLAKIAEK